MCKIKKVTNYKSKNNLLKETENYGKENHKERNV